MPEAICFLSLEGVISASSLPKYFAAVLKYHVLSHLPSPNGTSISKDLIKEFSHRSEKKRRDVQDRIGLYDAVARNTVALKLRTSKENVLWYEDTLLLQFLFQIPYVFLEYAKLEEVRFRETGLTVVSVLQYYGYRDPQTTEPIK